MNSARKLYLYKKLDVLYFRDLDFLDQDLDDATITYQEYDRWVVNLNKRYVNYRTWIKNDCKGKV